MIWNLATAILRTRTISMTMPMTTMVALRTHKVGEAEAEKSECRAPADQIG